MHLDHANDLNYIKHRAFISHYNEACSAAALFFDLDKAVDLDSRIALMDRHYDDLVMIRCSEYFDQLPPELVPTTTTELQQLIDFLSNVDPLQSIRFKSI